VWAAGEATGRGFLTAGRADIGAPTQQPSIGASRRGGEGTVRPVRGGLRRRCFWAHLQSSRLAAISTLYIIN